THVQPSQQRQTDGSPPAMPNDPGHRHPVVAIEKPGTSRTGRRIVMDAGSLHFPSVTLAGRVVESQQDTTLRCDHRHCKAKQSSGDGVDLVAQGVEEVIVVLGVITESAGPQPTGDRATTGGEQEASEKRSEPPGRVPMQDAAELIDPTVDVGTEAL